ncbi:MAG: hypothetical protein K6G03_04400 [Lachnospiraceae bacterium]|nr:hypothetical protein [Lachnospiraceae bacterium]
MSNRLDFIILGKKNRAVFEPFYPELDSKGSSPDEYLFGVMNGDEPYGVVLLKKDKKTLIISQISIDYTAENMTEILTAVLKGLIANIRGWGAEILSIKYTDNDIGITKRILKDAGFTEFKEEARVYRIDAYSLGSLLRDGPDSETLRSESVRILDLEKTRVFSLAPEKITDLYAGLIPEPRFSFLTLDQENKVGCCSIISKLADGTLYLSGLYNYGSDNADLMGVFYLSLASVFMEIEPDGEFYIPAINPRIKNIAEYFISPLKSEIEKNRIYSATAKNS